MVESQPSKLLVAGSIPVSRSRVQLKTVAVRVSKMFEQAVLAVTDEQTFARCRR